MRRIAFLLAMLAAMPALKAATMTLVYTITLSAPNYLGTLSANYTIYITVAGLFSTSKTGTVQMFNPIYYKDTLTYSIPDVLLPFAIDVNISADATAYYTNTVNGETTVVATLTNAVVNTQIVPGTTNTLKLNATFNGVGIYTGNVGYLSVEVILYIGKLPLYLLPLLGAALVAYLLRRK